jgi:hypothetical protein
MVGPAFPFGGGVLHPGLPAIVLDKTPPARLVSVKNPVAGVLVARFNQAMGLGDAETALDRWTVAPVDGGAAPLVLEALFTRPAYPEMATLAYSGGELGDYRLSVADVRAGNGRALAPDGNAVTFTLRYPDAPDSTIRLFDSVWGPVGMAQRASLRRTVDQLVANRALALGVNQQLQQRLAAAGTTAARDGRPGQGRG